MQAQVTVSAWLSAEDSDEYWAEGATAILEVEVVDTDEIRLGVMLDPAASDDATLYLNRATADKLARFLAAASVAPIHSTTSA